MHGVCIRPCDKDSLNYEESLRLGDMEVRNAERQKIKSTLWQMS